MVVLGWFALLVSLLVQAYGLYAPQAPGPAGVPGLDKVGHLLAFAVPAALAWWLRARWLVPVLVLHALVSEPLQQLLAPGRQADLLDAVADLLGVALGVWVAATTRRRWGHDGDMGETSTPTRRQS
ncbi:VanZ family protein [uncultured Serinicoccus sp.]|uniref:VanZ family protein n=1 Tax=uncultured Serinicoccus sp. TaxID=735514 RepID=UPI002616BE43|nr:VanZ family protein [uncultured Serinicoccus sp.]